MPKTIEELVNELKQEAWLEGFATCSYNHLDHSHTVAGRQKMLNHKAIAEQIKNEIIHLLKEKKK